MEIQVHKKESLKGSLLLVGFPSRGLVGGVAANFVIDELKMWHFASLYDRRLPPTVSVRDGVAYSPIQFFASAERCGPDGNCDKLVVALSEVPFDPKLLGEVADTIVAWAKREGVEHIVVLEGTEFTHEVAVGNGKKRAGRGPPKLRGVRSLASRHKFDKYQVEVVAAGVVSSYAAAFLLAANRHEADLVAFFIESAADFPDAGAAAALLQRVDPMLPHIDFETKRLAKRVKALEANMKSTIQRTKHELASIGRASEMMYA